MPVPRIICEGQLIEDVMERCANVMKTLMNSQADIEDNLLSLEIEIQKMKHPSPLHSVISAQDLISSLYGARVQFPFSLRLISVLPKVLYRFRPYRIVMELKGADGGKTAGVSSQFRVVPYSSKLPVKALDTSLVTFDSVKLSVVGSRLRVEMVNVKFQFTTKGCDFNHICLVIMHASEKVKPVVLEGVHIRARKKSHEMEC